MLQIKGRKTTIIFGYGDVMFGSKNEGESGVLRLAHFPDGVANGQVNVTKTTNEEFMRMKELVNIRFDNTASIDGFIYELQQIKNNMLIAKLERMLDRPRSEI